jgi:hypothetical protein
MINQSKNTKSLVLNLILLITSLSFLVAFKASNRFYQTECVTNNTDSYVTIKIWNTKKGSCYKPEQARKEAVHAILFSGVSGSNGCATQPPILNNSVEKENFMSIEKSFFSKNGKWSMYTRSSVIETTIPTSLGVKNWKVYQVSISKNELRKFLEEKQIIKSMTNGF